MKSRYLSVFALLLVLCCTVSSDAGISVSAPAYRYSYFSIWYGLGTPAPGKIAYVSVTKPNGSHFTIAQMENVSDYSQYCQLYADLAGWYTFSYEYSYVSQGVPRTTVYTQSYYIQTGNNLQWLSANPNPAVERPGYTSSISTSFKNIGSATWGGNHFIEFKDHYGTPIYYPSVAGIPVNGTGSAGYTVTLPNFGGPGTATYRLRGMENNVEFFGPQMDVPVGVDYPPNTTLSSSTTAVTGAASVQITSISSAPYSDLVNQAIDYWPPGATDWVTGTSGAGTRWDGGWVNSHTLAPWIQVTTPGNWQFRARGQNSRGQLSNFQYQNVTVGAGAAPATTLQASWGSTGLTGNTNSSAPPVLVVPYGQNFTVTGVSTDANSDLVTQQFDLSMNGGAWSLGNAGNSRLWSGGATNSNTLPKTFSSIELGAGTYRFRAQGRDAQNQYSTYQYIDVRISPAPVTTLVATSGSSSTSGNTNPTAPPALSVPLGQPFTITSTSTDSDNDLVAQQIDLSPNGGAWSLGNTTNNRLWQGAATSTHTLPKTFSSSEFGGGSFRFRAQGTDATGQLATYQYVDVVIVAPVAPSLTSQPGNVTAVVGQSATFSVMASGTAPLSYQWRKNGANIANATSASYTIASVQTGDAAGYSVFVSNTAGNVTSNPATLTVSAMQPIRLAVKYWQANDWPDITVDHYEDYWVDGNWVEGHEEEVWGWDENWNWVSTMQWVDGYQEEGHTESQWVGSTTYPDGQFGYRWDTTIGTFDIATAASGYNATTANRGYFLNAYNPGDKITFHLHATAPSANCSNYTWALFAPSGAQITGYWFSGITACSFDANYGAGYYRIDVSYQSATGVTPANATVSYYIPVGVSPPATPVVTSSLTASGTTGIAFNYTLTASNSPTSFATAGLPTGLSLNTANGAITGTPIIAGISNVTLTASNPSGSSPAVTLVLTVANGVPTISSSLTASGTTGTAFAYVITASNSPTSYSATSLPAGLALNVTTGAITGTPTAAGAFSVGLTATNAGGTSPSATLVLTIAGGAPTITTQPASQTVAVGQSVSFTVVAAGTPTPTYQWRKGGAALANGGVINGATSATLTISGVVAGDAGNYDVVALNSAGSATSGVVTLTVLPSGDDGTPQLKVFQPN